MNDLQCKVAEYLTWMGVCDEQSAQYDGDEPPYCDKGTCPYCDMARALQASIGKPVME